MRRRAAYSTQPHKHYKNAKYKHTQGHDILTKNSTYKQSFSKAKCLTDAKDPKDGCKRCLDRCNLAGTGSDLVDPEPSSARVKQNGWYVSPKHRTINTYSVIQVTSYKSFICQMHKMTQGQTGH